MRKGSEGGWRWRAKHWKDQRVVGALDGGKEGGRGDEVDLRSGPSASPFALRKASKRALKTRKPPLTSLTLSPSPSLPKAMNPGPLRVPLPSSLRGETTDRPRQRPVSVWDHNAARRPTTMMTLASQIKTSLVGSLFYDVVKTAPWYTS